MVGVGVASDGVVVWKVIKGTMVNIIGDAGGGRGWLPTNERRWRWRWRKGGMALALALVALVALTLVALVLVAAALVAVWAYLSLS